MYTEPLKIDKVTTVHASAYSPDKLRSLQQVAEFYITSTDSEDMFEIDSDGVITKYNGTNQYLAIPDTIKGITVKAIGTDAFNRKNMVMIKCPSSLTAVKDEAFDMCDTLRSFDADNLQYVGDHGFDMCTKLDYFDFSNLTYVGEHAFDTCMAISEIYNDKLEVINESSFEAVDNAVSVVFDNVKEVKYNGLAILGKANIVKLPKAEILGAGALWSCNATEIELPNLKTMESGGGQFENSHRLSEMILPNLEGSIPTGAFNGCDHLEQLYAPKITSIQRNAFNGSFPKLMFIPNAESIYSLPNIDGVTLYCSDKLVYAPSISGKTYHIIAPKDSYAQAWTTENGCEFTPSDYRDNTLSASSNVEDYGKTIRITDPGLRFGFSWDNLEEIEQYANCIEYGFIYHYNFDNEPYTSEQLTIENVDKDGIKKKVANNRIDHGENTTFNLVFTNISVANYDTNISARAYVCIDGMYFYSNTLNGSFKATAKAITNSQGNYVTKEYTTTAHQIQQSENETDNSIAGNNSSYPTRSQTSSQKQSDDNNVSFEITTQQNDTSPRTTTNKNQIEEPSSASSQATESVTDSEGWINKWY